MAFLQRVPSMPAEIRALLRLQRGERVLAVAQLGGGWAVATTTRLHVVTDGAATADGWDRIAHARWDSELNAIEIEWADAHPDVTLAFAGKPGRFPAVLRDRTESSVVATDHVDIGHGQYARIAIRRGPDGLYSEVIVDGDAGPISPAKQALIDAAEDRLRSHAGLPL